MSDTGSMDTRVAPGNDDICPEIGDFLSAASFLAPDRVVSSAWTEHAPFAFWLAAALRPRRIVELGVHSGFSYFAFCQAVEHFGLETDCFGVDTWMGDEHAGFYDPQVFADVSRHNAERYASFSHLIRSTFDEAQPHFANGSIDLLHIDGRHFYNDVKHDYETWCDQLSTRAVVLFHDTNVHGRGFGVARLWSELRGSFPSFEFKHGHGLGVLCFGAETPAAVGRLCNLTPPRMRQCVRAAYARLGQGIFTQFVLEDVRAELARSKTKVSEFRGSAVHLKRTLEELQEESAKLRAAVNHAAGDGARLNAALLRSEEKAAALAEGLKRTQARVHAFRMQMYAEQARWRAEHARAEAAAEQARCLDTALAAERARAQAAEDRLSAMYASTTWQLTRPLRAVASRAPVRARLLARGRLQAAKRAAMGAWHRAGLPSDLSAGSQLGVDVRASFEPTTLVGSDYSGLSASTAEAPARPESIPLGTEDDFSYANWIRLYDTLTDADRAAIRAHIAHFAERPVISVVMPVYETAEELLRAAIASVRSQLYPYWELCIADDASPSSHIEQILREEAAADSRIRWVRRETNGHISRATNSALALATGAFVAFMDHDDLLSERALYEVVGELDKHPDANLLYSDQDRINAEGIRHTPYFKTEWDPDLMLGHNMVSHLGVYRRSLIQEIGGVRDGLEGSQDYDMTLRFVDATTPDRIRHIPAVLYHWREVAGGPSVSQTQLDRCIIASRLAIKDHLQRLSFVPAEVSSALPARFWNRVKWLLPTPAPRVSIIVPTRDQGSLLARCTAGLLQRTDYPDMEVLIVDNDSHEPDAKLVIEGLAKDERVRVVRAPGPFNFSAIINLGVSAAAGEVLVLLNNDVDVIDHDWLRELVTQAIRPEVGAVGAKLLYPDTTIQYAGTVLGVGNPEGGSGVADHFGVHASRSDLGYMGFHVLARQVSAVTAACMALRKEVFQAVGGMDANNLAVAYNDVDLCLRIRERGLNIVWTPFAELLHLESASRGLDYTGENVNRFRREWAYMRDRWGPTLDSDPFHNPNFSWSNNTFALGFPPRREKSWRDFMH